MIWMHRVFNGLPSLFLVAMLATFLFVNCEKEAVWGMAIAAILWAFHFYMSRPAPIIPPPDDGRIAALEKQIESFNSQLDSVRAAVNMRQLR